MSEHRARGAVRHYAGVLTAETAIPAGKIMLEREAAMRGRRLAETMRDRLQQRRSPSRKRMRALIANPGGKFEWSDVPAPPPPGPLAAIVHPIAVATCDLDRAMGLGRTPFPLPMHFGHECVADVIAVGEQVTTVRPGDRVVVPFQISCGNCDKCRVGLTSNCAAVPPISMYGFGIVGGHWGGAFSDQLTVPFADGMLVPLPDGIDPVAAASVADNVSDGYRTIAAHLPGLLERSPDTDVLILSDLGRSTPFSASVALYAGMTALALGAREVHFLDRREHVRNEARTLALSAHRPGELRLLPKAPLVVDCTGINAGPRIGLRHTAPDGICVSPGGLTRSARIPIAEMYGRNASFHLARSHARTNIPLVLDLMLAGKLHPERVTTATGALDDAPSAIRRHVHGEDTKTILHE